MPSRTTQQKEKLYASLGPCCHYCQSLMTVRVATVDHIVPRMFGGPSVMWNMVLACKTCNESKSAKVGVCECDRCRRAMNRFRMGRERPDDALKQRYGHSKRKVRTPEQAMARIAARIEGGRQSLDGIHAQDPMIAASIRGYVHGLQTALDLLRTVTDDDEPKSNRRTVAAVAVGLAYAAPVPANDGAA